MRCGNYFTLAQVADLLSVSEKTVHRMKNERGLPHFRAGAVIRFEAGALQKWLKKNTCSKHGG
ncbi:MAG: helix-turn-helix domain-containing protein [Thermoanaerobaculales bacterium]|nr:helix-turn-helix domain-containing protein [Thermoanaerobaculales bacterium]